MMKFILAVMIVIEVGTAAAAQLFITQPSEGVPLLTMLPADAATVADYYKQKVYDSADEKIGEIVDLIIEKSGYVPAVIIAVSGFLGIIGTKYVAVPFAALQVNQKEHKEHIVLDTNKRALKNAPALEYNRSTKRWERVEE
jgi:hypothetical protein